MLWRNDIRIVVGLGFAYCHTASACQEICTNTDWEELTGHYKTNTVLQYDEKLDKAVSWGKPAFAKRAERKSKAQDEPKSVGLFKLHLGKLQDDLKPKIPVDYKIAITDYFREMGKLIKSKINNHWPDMNFHENVLLVISVLAEYSKKEMAIIRESEAAAIYCMKKCLKEYSLASIGTTFMIVDCSGGTVDLTTCKIEDENQLSEITERTGDYCESSFIDEAFLKYLSSIVGDSTINILKDKKSKSLQYMVQHFCRKAKFPFTGEDPDFCYELDILDIIKVLRKCVKDEIKEKLDKINWLIEIDYEKIKSMFDPIVERILNMIETQLNNSRDECSIMFLVGGFGQSKYLKNRIEEKFKDRVKTIVVPKDLIAAVVRDATLYGLSLYDQLEEKIPFILKNQILNYTYGIKVLMELTKSDPPELKTIDGYVEKFHCIAKRGTVIDIDKEILVSDLCPINEFQSSATFYIYFTKEYHPKYCAGMELLGTLKIDLSDRGPNRSVSFALSFGQMELTATARNETNGQNYHAIFKIDEDLGVSKKKCNYINN
ncbi:unnamed protein product [Rhizophagus irregularis]|uniref:Actin-like ATPase domain-containing protein n=1 Tax=Rhizophagus irregularis TaxID=588596 RepID=A0A2N1MH35_9GLOM|nr:hypothetical protein RhiirC2_792518 [Rhizophagus irregularis]CAB4387228.1 unnamed protein product [Rhizophagus irregularis]CAB4398582.1 unnamed protein product [Rhizophagus irregularis]